MPPHLGVESGGVAGLHEDVRIDWALQLLGGVEGKTVLELGPLEAAHTSMLERAGAAHVTSIEGNAAAFQRCLIVKELLGLRRSRFLLGNFVSYLKENDTVFDLCVASGVLYHMKNPVELIELLSRRVEKLFVWTHFYDEELVGADPRTKKYFAGCWDATHSGFSHRLHAHGYGDALDWKGFCGGGSESSNWMEKPDLLAAFEYFGFKKVGEREEPTHPHGPAIWLALEKA
ncbi:class I SAM-dependent methyltransferase [Pelagicoccus enzymogenes]|uniref:class I SAM-dependent methyltransferase n=1 Tax=Pelagicoccus enzymogenes TaxID=2773457 RepID=UPI00280C7626|nr:class I SAM-dependent methyltransferase [Pelagicoccus enzymogenes]MDQ8197544.1 class I SAM-dependent methyltransferase [Pelagicoccus enzymogenes]